MKSKKLQKVMVDYTDKVALVLDEEIRGGGELIKDWIKYPHSHSVSPDARNALTLESL